MVGQIIPVRKTAEDETSVTYTWGFPGDEKVTVIDKASREVSAVAGSLDDSLYLDDYLRKVREINKMTDYPDEAPIYR